MAWKSSKIIFVIFATFLTRTQSCEPCQNKACNTDVSQCKDGVVRDACDCCDVCARGEGETCGGLFYNHGKCGKGLNCVRRRANTVKVLGENDLVSGICERDECRDKVCGFNERCLVNSRGKARCVCPKYCKNRYMPVCGEKNGRHYWNRCYLRKDECRRQERIGFRNGPCKSCHDNGKSYKSGKTITRKDKCEKCVCRHGEWICENDLLCRSEDLPDFCEVKKNDCPEGFHCEAGKYEPSVPFMNIGIGLCIPVDEERPTNDEAELSGDDECPKLKCGPCRHGYAKDSQGCATCECIKVEDHQKMSISDQSQLITENRANNQTLYTDLVAIRLIATKSVYNVLYQADQTHMIECDEGWRTVFYCLLVRAGGFSETKEKNICERPRNPGPCKQNLTRFYYNSQKGRCFQFRFGGCLSNGNNFATKKKCEKHCSKSKAMQ